MSDKLSQLQELKDMTYALHAEEERKAKARARRDKQKANKGSYSQPEWRGWVSYPRTKAAREQCDQFTDDVGMVWEHLETLLTAGLRLSVSVDEKDDSFTAVFTVKDTKRSDSGLGLSAFADTAGEAVGRAVYFVSVVGNGKLDHTAFDLPDGQRAKRDFWGD